ncbi:MAG: hypothetical protein LBP62_06905, partial [Clostridiales bacterium]|nr:hypothetical protein [Clostridiales bacterium]
PEPFSKTFSNAEGNLRISYFGKNFLKKVFPEPFSKTFSNLFYLKNAEENFFIKSFPPPSFQKLLVILRRI